MCKPFRRPGLLLVAPLLLLLPAISHAQVCGDFIWETGEFCGQDAWNDAGVLDMNHDCFQDYMDVVLFNVGLNANDPTSDLDGDFTWGLSDITIFGSNFMAGTPLGCSPSGMQPDACDGLIALSHSPDPFNIIASQSLPIGLNFAYVVVDGVIDAYSFEYSFVSSPNITILDHVEQPGLSDLQQLIAANDAHVIVLDETGTTNAGPVVVAEIIFLVTDANPAYLELMPVPSFPGRIRWAELAHDRSIDFASVSNLGINGPEPAGNSTCANFPPDVTIDTPPGNDSVSYAQTFYDFDGTASDIDGFIVGVEYRVNGSPWSPAAGAGVWSFTATNLLVGPNTVDVRSQDDVGDYSPLDSRIITRDPNMLPTVTIQTPSGNDTIAHVETTYDFDGTATDIDGSVIQVQYRVNGGPWNPTVGIGSWSFTATNLLVGDNDVEVRARDDAGEYGPTAARIITRLPNVLPTVNITIPPFPVGVDYPTTSYNFEGLASDTDGSVVAVEVRLNGGGWLVANGTNTWNFLVTGLVVGGNLVEVRAQDDVGAYGPLDSETVTRSPNVPPEIAIYNPLTNVTIPNTQTTYDFDGGSTDYDGTVVVIEYRLNGGGWTAATGTSVWSFQATGLGIGANLVDVRAQDDVGDFSPTLSRTVTRQDPPDLTITNIDAPAEVVEGCSAIPADLTLSNISQGPAGSFRVSLLLSEDTTPDPGDVNLINFPVPTFPALFDSIVHLPDFDLPPWPAGEVWLIGVADDLDEQQESDENNNVFVKFLDYPIPFVDAIVDVPNDNGRQVRITFWPSSRDVLGSLTPILQYELFRKIEPIPKESDLAARQQRARDDGMVSTLDILAQGWDFVGLVPAHGESEYSVIAPTLVDLQDSEFFVRAATAAPLVFFDSCSNAGQSEDNLAPSVPKSFVVSYESGGNQLSWDEALEEDFRYYRVYRGISGAPKEDPVLVDTTIETTWIEPEAPGWQFVYWVAAVDFAGNESPLATPGDVTGIEDGTPSRFSLSQNRPNPFNPSTVIEYSVPAEGGRVLLRVYDATGRLVRVLVDEIQEAGARDVTWYGRDDQGKSVASGVYFCELIVGEHRKTMKMTLVQ